MAKKSSKSRDSFRVCYSLYIALKGDYDMASVIAEIEKARASADVVESSLTVKDFTVKGGEKKGYHVENRESETRVREYDGKDPAIRFGLLSDGLGKVEQALAHVGCPMPVKLELLDGSLKDWLKGFPKATTKATTTAAAAAQA